MSDDRHNRGCGLAIAALILLGILFAWATGQEPHRELRRLEQQRLQQGGGK